MERPEQLVPGDLQRPVVTLEIPVVHLVVERAQFQAVLVFHHQPLEARMGRGGGERVVL